MSDQRPAFDEITIPQGSGVPAHLSVDPYWDALTVIEYGAVWDGPAPDMILALADDERVMFLLRDPDGPVMAMMVQELHEVDVDEIDDDELWDGPRFTVPVLGLTCASAGEIILAVQARFAEEEATNDAGFFHLGIQATQEDDYDQAAHFFRLALEAGDMKAKFALGYSLVDAGHPREGYDHLRRYTELAPYNAWAWNWLGQAAEATDETAEAANAYREAIRLEEEFESFETDADERLEALEGLG